MAQASETTRTYEKLYRQVVQKHGVRAPGRNIVRHGVRVKPDVVRSAHVTEVRKSIGILNRMLIPVVVVARRTTFVRARAAEVYRKNGTGGLPYCTWGPESGGNYRARNASGAGGKYQIMPQTWKSYGGSGANAADAAPAEQEAVARRIHSAEGTRPWVNC